MFFSFQGIGSISSFSFFTPTSRRGHVGDHDRVVKRQQSEASYYNPDKDYFDKTNVFSSPRNNFENISEKFKRTIDQSLYSNQ